MKPFLILPALVLVGCATIPSGGLGSQGLPPAQAGSSVTRLTVTNTNLGIGSGLEFASLEAGEYVFWGITDRGPNLDGPGVGGLTSKVFPDPGFHPSLVEIRVKDDQARVTKWVPLKVGDRAISGLPVPRGTVGFSQEVALSTDLKDLGSDPDGLDTEAVRLDPKRPGQAWISDEYGPFVARVDLATGRILQKLAPGAGLPQELALRQPNRGMEGLAVTPSGLVVGVVQSILDTGNVKESKAPFVRLVTYNPANGKTAQYAYPLDADAYKKTADAKIGDLVALSDTEFLILEQGKDKKGLRNLVYKLSLVGATDLTGVTAGGRPLETLGGWAELKAAGMVPATKRLVMDLRAEWGWSVEKAEGLAVIDNRRFAVISDNDFGVVTEVVNPASKDGKAVTDATAYELVDGRLVLAGQPTDATVRAGENREATAFWMVTTEKPFF